MAGALRERVIILNRITKESPVNANFESILHAEDWLMRNGYHPDDFMYVYAWMRDKEI